MFLKARQLGIAAVCHEVDEGYDSLYIEVVSESASNANRCSIECHVFRH